MTKKLDKSYLHFINNLKTEIKTSRIKAHLAVNRELVLLYFKIGKLILEKQREEGWGAKIIERISDDLRSEFPEMKGLSRANIFFMRKFAEIYLDEITHQSALRPEKSSTNKIVQQPARQLQNLPFFDIPWWHNVVLMDNSLTNSQRLWYANQTIENGWSRNVLMHQIKSNLYHRQVSSGKTHNFDLTLSGIQSELAISLLKDEYNFEFLRGSDFKEKELEDQLVENIVKFLLELGRGFAFIGKQYHLEVGGQDFYIDLLFYNLELRCFVVIELKTGEFKPEYVGKLAFYLSVIDEKLKKSHDKDTMGIILCTKNNREVSKHLIRYMMKPFGVSEYKIANKIEDKKIRAIVPTPEELEKNLFSNTKSSKNFI